jgi:hypothetical protein
MTRRGFALVVAVGLAPVLLATTVVGSEVGSDALLPIPGLLRPKPKPPKDPTRKHRVRGACEVASLPALKERLPFGPGELMTYDVAVMGLRTGRIRMRVGERTEMDGVGVYPLHAQAKTSGFVSVLGELDGRMVSFMDPQPVRPVRMANRFLIDTIMQPPLFAREDAAFSVDAQVAARLTYRQDGKENTRPAKMRSTSDLLDVLSVVYYMRSRALRPGTRYCFEIYHRRRLWRVEGGVGELKLIRSPFVTRRAREVWGELTLVGSKSREPRKVTAWVSEDDDRLPLLVETPDNFGKLQVKLAAWIPGRRLVRSR